MGRANQPMRPFNLGPYVSAMMAAGDSKLKGAAAIGGAMRDVGDKATGLGMEIGRRKEAEKDRAFKSRENEKWRALQREMQAKGQRLGWARLQWDKQTSLLNELDDDLQMAQSQLQRFEHDAALGTVDPAELQKQQAEVQRIESMKAAVRNAVFSTGHQSGVVPADFDTDSYLAGAGAATVSMEDTCEGPT